MDAVRVVRAANLSPETAQTTGMNRRAAIDAASCGSRSIWAGRVTMDAGVRSGAHHHGDCESVIFMIAGEAVFRFGDSLEHEVAAGPGDFVYIPPGLVHQEINRSATAPIDCLVIRDRGENVVVNVEVPGA
jgi:uncharacterized RmlC-like cupin family protein